MRRHASFDPDQAPRHIGEPGCDPAAGNLLPQNDCPLVVEADQMQGVLACIDPNGSCHCGCLLGHGDVLLVLLSPSPFSERFGAGAQPVHPILRNPAFLPTVAAFLEKKSSNRGVSSAEALNSSLQSQRNSGPAYP